MEDMADPSAATRLIEAYANTIDIEDRTDAITTPGELGAWLSAHDLLPRDAPVSDEDLARARALRAGLRERLLASNGEEPDRDLVAQAEEVFAGLPLTVRLSPADPLAPGPREGVSRALAVIAAAWAHTAATGEWLRLKQCPNHECGWVFWDATRSRTRRWCSMRVCGNRAKARAHAERNRAT